MKLLISPSSSSPTQLPHDQKQPDKPLDHHLSCQENLKHAVATARARFWIAIYPLKSAETLCSCIIARSKLQAVYVA
jgi:hypothetical protein